MENNLGKNIRQYRNVVIRSSSISDNTVLGDDVFITNSIIGKNCTVERRGMVFNSTINDYSYTGYNSVVKYAQIGKYCSISWNVSLGGANHDYTRITTHPFPFKKKYRFVSEDIQYKSFTEEPLVIGNDVWIGSNVCVLRGVSIGSGAIIGAGCVVTKDVSPYAIVVGSPAKVLKYRFEEDTIKALLEINWWDWPDEVISSNLDLFNKPITDEIIRKLYSVYRTIEK